MSATILAYSYARFSSPEQAKGDSLRRQAELRDAFVAEVGATLDTSITLRDEGVSAYHGDHRANPDRNALAAFLRLVERGRIPRGSYLIVESLDRLTREDIRPALSLLLLLIEAGVRVVQLLPVRMVYDENTDPMGLMMAILELSRAHSESRMKSERVGRAWRQKKKAAQEEGRPLTARLPAWLRMEDGRIVADPEKSAVVQRVYRLAVAGHGLGAITKALNAEGVPTVSGGPHWSRSYIARLLADRRPAGECQPHSGRGPDRKPDGPPVPGYYPAVVTDAEWHAAQAALAGRRGGGGRGDGDVNVFQGLLVDARDGGSIVRMDKGGGHNLVSYRATQGVPGSVYVSFPAAVFEAAVLGRLREIDPRDLLPPDDTVDEVLALEGRLAALDVRLTALAAQVQRHPESDALVAALVAVEAERREAAGRLAEARRRAATPLGKAWEAAGGLLAALDAAPDRRDARVRMRGLLRRLVKTIHCLFVAVGARRLAAVQVRFSGGGVRDYLIIHRPAWADGGRVGPRREATTEVRSVPHGDGPPLDLADAEHVRRLESALLQL